MSTEPKPHVYIEGEAYEIDTPEQAESVAALLHDLGLSEAPVYVGEGPDEHANGMILFAKARGES